MRSILLLTALCATPAAGADLASVRTVYILQMTAGLDQYLANQLTTEGIFEVVTDPKRADAVITDQIGRGFEDRLEELYPADEKEAEKKKEAADSNKVGESVRPRSSSFHRGRGNIFLVDVQSRRVVWSVYERPKEMTPDHLDRTSARIVARLKKDRQPSR